MNYQKNKTVKEITEEKGVKTYDTALPQEWVDAARKICTINPVGNIVWAYKIEKQEPLWGIPVAVSNEGEVLLGVLAGSVK